MELLPQLVQSDFMEDNIVIVHSLRDITKLTSTKCLHEKPARLFKSRNVHRTTSASSHAVFAAAGDKRRPQS